MRFSDLKVGVRLGMGFGIVVGLMLLLGGFAIYRLTVINGEVQQVVDDRWPKTVALNEIKGNVNVVARALRNTIITDDPAEAEKELKRVEAAREAIGKRLEELNQSIGSGEGKTLLVKVQETRAEYIKAQKHIIDLVTGGRKDEARKELFGSVRKAQQDYFAALDGLIVYQGKMMEKAGHEVEAHATAARGLIIGILVVAGVLSIVFAVIVVRSITKPISVLLEGNERLAEGDLTVDIRVDRKDEIGVLQKSSRQVIERLRELLGEVSDTSTQVASAANQLYATSEQIATGAEQVAAQSGTVATAGEEMAATSGDIAQSCQRAAEGALQTNHAAQNGAAVVQNTVVVMGEIAGKVRDTAKTVEILGERSDQIGAIVGTIEDIADQTNLLALNAAIEAARAGEQGRGFAVVADEVRALAERTTRATREISEMIKVIQGETKSAVASMEEGVRQVERGTSEAARSGEALREILDQVNAVTMQINQIATAAEEQTATTSEITNNIHQISDVVQQTAAGAQESAGAAGQLATHSEELQRLVGRFKLA